jgi:hypothetical protein
VPKSFGDHVPNVKKIRRLRRSSAENLDMSRQVWDSSEAYLTPPLVL